MALVATVVTSSSRSDLVNKALTTPMLNGDTSTPLISEDFDTVSLQASGTFGAGGSISIEGSNDGVTFAILNDRAGAAATLTAAGFVVVREVCAFMREHVTAGDGTTSITSTLMIRKLKNSKY